MLRTSSYLAVLAYIRDAGRDPLMSSATQAPRSDRLRADGTGVGRIAGVGRMPPASSYLADFAYLGDPRLRRRAQTVERLGSRTNSSRMSPTSSTSAMPSTP